MHENKNNCRMRSTSGLIERFSNFFEEPFEEGTFLLKFSTLLLVVSWNLRVYLFFFFLSTNFHTVMEGNYDWMKIEEFFVSSFRRYI